MQEVSDKVRAVAGVLAEELMDWDEDLVEELTTRPLHGDKEPIHWIVEKVLKAAAEPVRASEEEWLRFFYHNAESSLKFKLKEDEKLVDVVKEYFLEKTGKLLPEGYDK